MKIIGILGQGAVVYSTWYRTIVALPKGKENDLTRCREGSKITPLRVFS